MQLPNREILALEIVRHPGGAVVAARDDRDRVALIRQFRHAAGGWIWEFPAGLAEPGEAPLEAARRELREETGCRASTWESLGSTLTTPGFCTERLHLFLATDLRVAEADLQRHEFIETHWVALPQAMEMAQRGEIDDAKTIVTLFRMMRPAPSQ
ncbi:MAG: NUDIX hydrolase [Gammaproteobacteria bacterium]|nr:NUDIX hydrolase [Gammaproteobacteria bacterium]MDD9875236.1 NUDIX hydrolase [Gammaproteobacteria bacterium]